MTEANHGPLTIHDALRDSPCPRPANGEPDDQTVGSCVDKGQCGCQNGEALTADASLHAELVAALFNLVEAVESAVDLDDHLRSFGVRVAAARALLQKAKQP